MIYYPKELRDKDKTKFELKSLNEMNREDAKKFEEVSKYEERFEDIPTSHPLIKEVEEREAEDIKRLEPDRQKILARYDRMKKKKTLKQLREFIKEANDDFDNEVEMDYVNSREERKRNRERGKEKKDKKGKF